jgi:peptide chain release factor 2
LGGVKFARPDFSRDKPLPSTKHQPPAWQSAPACAILNAWPPSTSSASASRRSKKNTTNCGGIFDLPGLRSRLAALDKEVSNPENWADAEKRQSLGQERARTERKLAFYESVERAHQDAATYLELLHEGEDAGKDLEAALGDFSKLLERLEISLMLSGENDARGAFLSINAGAGGTESQDWAEMLLRMYLRWAEGRGYETHIVDRQVGEEAGVKSATLRVTGEYAYGYLKAESGVHRLVRLSPFDANHRRHTSFASVFAYPEVDDSIQIQIEDKDLRVDTFRAGGHGGQHVNVTDSAVRIVHLPTNITVQCQNERSQHKNRAMAMRVLRARLYEHERQKRAVEREKQEAQKKDIAWGSQIRSYVLHPYKMVKDHRTGREAGDAQRVLDGDLDEFMAAYLLKAAPKEAQAAPQAGK